MKLFRRLFSLLVASFIMLGVFTTAPVLALSADDVASDFDSEVYHFVFRDVSLPDIIPNIPDENGEYPVAPGYVTVNFFIPEEYKAGAHLEGVASYLVNPEAMYYIQN